jgi:hypothetical protein
MLGRLLMISPKILEEANEGIKSIMMMVQFGALRGLEIAHMEAVNGNVGRVRGIAEEVVGARVFALTVV